MTVGLYAKAIVAAVATGLTAAVTALDDGFISGPEWAAVAVATLVAAGAVWAVPNQHAGVARYGKAITAAVIAGVGAWGTALTAAGTITAADWLTIAVAVIAGSGLTYAVPNADWSDSFRVA